MTMRFSLVTVVLSLALAGCIYSRPDSASGDERPNIVLFLADDLGYGYVGAYGNDAIRTPHLDGLAREGLRFTNAFAGSPTCSPSRAVLYTGLMPLRNGAFLNHSHIHPHIKTLPHYLSKLGYRVVLMHKQHIGPESAYPFEYHPAALPQNPTRDRRYRGEGLDTDFVDQALTRHAADPDRKPLCLVLAASAPHVNWQEIEGYDPAELPLPPYLVDTPETRAGMARYYSDITEMDRKLGRILDSLDRHGMTKNTVFIFTSDQGAEWPHEKWNLYDAGIRTPLIIRWPGRVKPGKTTDAMVSLVDMLPTFVDLAGGQPIDGLDGRSFRHLLNQPSGEHRRAIYASHSGDGRMNDFPMRAVRTRTHKLILNLSPENTYTTHFVKAMDADHGLIWKTWEEKAATDPHAAQLIQTFQHRPQYELYDLFTDPHEMHNLAADPAHAATLADLKWKLETWSAAQSDLGLKSEEEGRRRQEVQIEEMRRRREASDR